MWEMDWTMYLDMAEYKKFLYGVLKIMPEPYAEIDNSAYGESYGYRTVRYAPGSL